MPSIRRHAAAWRQSGVVKGAVSFPGRYDPFPIGMAEDIDISHIDESKVAVQPLRVGVDGVDSESDIEPPAQSLVYLMLQEHTPESSATVFRQYSERVEIILPCLALVLHIAEVYAHMLFHESHCDTPHIAVAAAVVCCYHAGRLAVNLDNSGVGGRVQHIIAHAYLLGEETYAALWSVAHEHGGMESLRYEERVGMCRLAECYHSLMFTVGAMGSHRNGRMVV